MILDIALQALATTLLLFGLWHMGDHRRIGPLLAAVSEVLWVGVGLWHSIWGLVVLSVILGIVQGRNFLNWHRDGVPW